MAAVAAALLPPTHDSLLLHRSPSPAFSFSSSLNPSKPSPSLHLFRWMSQKPPRRSCRRGAASAGPPPPVPEPEPPFGKGPNELAGAQEIFSSIQDRVRIFLAVLFWMSLFFWGSARDGRDNARKGKGPRFRK